MAFANLIDSLRGDVKQAITATGLDVLGTKAGGVAADDTGTRVVEELFYSDLVPASGSDIEGAFFRVAGRRPAGEDIAFIAAQLRTFGWCARHAG